MKKHLTPHGFTLTEFLIAGFLASLLMLGMSYFISASWQAFRYQTSLTHSQEAAHTFFALITQDIALARVTETFPINWDSSSNDSGGSDRLSLRYTSSTGNDKNCLGNQENGVIVNTYYLRPASDSPFQTNDIICTAHNRSDTIVQHIELMKVRYGMDKGRFVNGVFVHQPDGLIDSWTTQLSEASQQKLVSMDIVLITKALITKSRFRDKSISTPSSSVWGRPLSDFGIDTQDGYFRLSHSARFNFVQNP